MTAKTIRVDVTAEDIAGGGRSSPVSCPVAIAISRAMGTPIAIHRARRNNHWVGVATMGLLIGGEPIEFRLSRSVGEFTARFDHEKPVEPFTFRVVR